MFEVRKSIYEKNKYKITRVKVTENSSEIESVQNVKIHELDCDAKSFHCSRLHNLLQLADVRSLGQIPKKDHQHRKQNALFRPRK